MDSLKKRIAALKEALTVDEQALFDESLKLGNTPERAYEYVVGLRRLYEVYNDEVASDSADEGMQRASAAPRDVAKTA